MKRLRSLLLAFLLCSPSFQVLGQVEHVILSGEKESYLLNEEVKVQFILHPDPKACKDGMEKTGVYASGMEIINRSNWIEIAKGTWQITILCRITGNKKGIGQLTIVRKNDRDNLFSQLKFKVNQHG